MDLFQNYLLCYFEAADVSSTGTENFILGLTGSVSLYALGRLHASWVCHFFVGILHPKAPRAHYCFMGVWIQLLWSTINTHPILTRMTQQSSHVPLASSSSSALGFVRSSLDQRFTMKTPVVRRILVFRVIASPILVPCRAREPVAMVRRILVMSPESSHHRYEAILVFTRARMCGHLPLICSAYTKKPAKLTSAFLMNRSISFSP